MVLLFGKKLCLLKLSMLSCHQNNCYWATGHSESSTRPAALNAAAAQNPSHGNGQSLPGGQRLGAKCNVFQNRPSAAPGGGGSGGGWNLKALPGQAGSRSRAEPDSMIAPFPSPSSTVRDTAAIRV